MSLFYTDKNWQVENHWFILYGRKITFCSHRTLHLWRNVRNTISCVWLFTWAETECGKHTSWDNLSSTVVHILFSEFKFLSLLKEKLEHTPIQLICYLVRTFSPLIVINLNFLLQMLRNFRLWFKCNFFRITFVYCNIFPTGSRHWTTQLFHYFLCANLLSHTFF